MSSTAKLGVSLVAAKHAAHEIGIFVIEKADTEEVVAQRTQKPGKAPTVERKGIGPVDTRTRGIDLSVAKISDAVADRPRLLRSVVPDHIAEAEASVILHAF